MYKLLFRIHLILLHLIYLMVTSEVLLLSTLLAKLLLNLFKFSLAFYHPIKHSIKFKLVHLAHLTKEVSQILIIWFLLESQLPTVFDERIKLLGHASA